MATDQPTGKQHGDDGRHRADGHVVATHCGSMRAAPSLGLGILVAASFIVVETLGMLLLRQLSPQEVFGTLYLLGVVVVSTVWGLVLAMTTSVVSAIVLDYFRHWPDRHFAFNLENGVVIIVFLVVALLTMCVAAVVAAVVVAAVVVAALVAPMRLRFRAIPGPSCTTWLAPFRLLLKREPLTARGPMAVVVLLLPKVLNANPKVDGTGSPPVSAAVSAAAVNAAESAVKAAEAAH